MTDLGGVRVYWGHSNYKARTALEKMEEPHGMLSAEAANAATWSACEDLFVDSGGYQLMLDEGEHPPLEEYLKQVRDWGGCKFAVQDYPCEPDILSKYGRSVQTHQELTAEAAAQAIAWYQDGRIDAEPVSVIQGWKKREYLDHIDRLRENGLLTDTIGIGSVCRRHQVNEIQSIILAIREELPSKYDLHAFGVKRNILADARVRDALSSVDTTAWYFRNFDDSTAIDETWQEMVSLYLDYRRELAKLAGELQEPSKNQSTLMESVTATDGGPNQNDAPR